MAARQAASFLDHVLVSGCRDRVNGYRDVLSRSWLGVGFAVGDGMSLPKPIRSACRFLFGDSWRAFGSLSVLLLILLAVVPAKDHFREWLHYQREYQNLIRNRSDAVSLARRFQGGVQQIWLPELGVVDRCTTCHVALKEASLTGVGTQPFRPHPP